MPKLQDLFSALVSKYLRGRGVFVVMLAEAGIQGISKAIGWIALRLTVYPAFAGMTGV
jgi:hypothetical protein